MFVTWSRNSDLYVKRFAKYFTKYFPNLKVIPRGKSDLKSIFEKSFYIGYKYFLVFSKLKNSKNIILNIYEKNDALKSYIFSDKLIFSDINLKKDFEYSFLNKIKEDLYIENKLFYFLNFSSNSESNYVGSVINNKLQLKLDSKLLEFTFKISK